MLAGMDTGDPIPRRFAAAPESGIDVDVIEERPVLDMLVGLREESATSGFPHTRVIHFREVVLLAGGFKPMAEPAHVFEEPHDRTAGLHALGL